VEQEYCQRPAALAGGRKGWHMGCSLPAMLLLRRARVPVALVPPALAPAAPDPLEPTVLCDLTIRGSAITAVAAAATGPASGAGERAVDLDGALVFPGLVDAHVHLDKAHTWSRAPNRSGTFAEALRVLGEDRRNWTRADLLRRADFTLQCAWAHGTRVVRTHVDTGVGWSETSHAAMAELRERWRGRIVLQTVPLGPVADEADRHAEVLADMALRHGASALGGFLPMAPGLPRQLDRLLAVARERGVGIDLHVDENGDPQSEVLRAVAEAVLRHQFPFPVVCGHCCSLAVQAPERQRETIRLVREAGIGVIALPLCNLYLQDRSAGPVRTPRWRGITLIHELLDAGVPVACASDNVRDAFHAYGDLDALEVYVQSVRLAHLDSRLAESATVVTRTAADLVGLPEFGRIAPGAPARLVVLAAASFSELLSRPGGPRRCVDGETIHATPPPDYRDLGDGAGLLPAP
jgi:cytosine deaminase